MLDKTNDYLVGRQYPDSWDPGETSDAYMTVPLIAPLVNRKAALIGGGRLAIVPELRDESPAPLIKQARSLWDMWTDLSGLKTKVHQAITDLAAFDVGVLRFSVDLTERPEIGGMITVDRIYPGQVWWSPKARNPAGPIMGSNYIGYETAIRREDLMKMYPKKARRIKELKAVQPYGRGHTDILEPTHAMFASEIGRDEAPDRGDDDFFIGISHDRTLKGQDRSDDYLLVTEYQWKTVESVEVVEGLELPQQTWHSMRSVGGLSGKDSDAIVIDDPQVLPYGMPTFVTFPGSVRTDGAYGHGILADVGDLQDIENTLMSTLIKVMAIDAKLRGVVFLDGEVLDPQQKYKIESGELPETMMINTVGTSREAQPLNSVFARFTQDTNDFSKHINTIQMVQKLMRDVVDIQSAVLGDTDVEKRVSGIALSTAQQAGVLGQETPRIFVDNAMQHVGRIAWAMIQRHWGIPMQLPEIGQAAGSFINQRIPAGRAETESVDRILDTGEFESGGKATVPNALFVVDREENEEVAISLSDDEGVDRAFAIANSFPEQFRLEYGINYIPIADLTFRLTIDAEYDQKRQQRIERLGAVFDLLGQGALSKETVLTELLAEFPGWTLDQERERLFGDQWSDIMALVLSKPDEVQNAALQVLGQFITQTEGGASGATPSATPGPTPPTV